MISVRNLLYINHLETYKLAEHVKLISSKVLYMTQKCHFICIISQLYSALNMVNCADISCTSRASKFVEKGKSFIKFYWSKRISMPTMDT